MKRKLAFVLVLGVLFGIFGGASSSRADEIYTFVVKKQEEKAKSRWSLSDWLETRDKMRLMDLWLALHSPSPYEFYVGGAYRSGDQDGANRFKGWDLSAGAYASIFGLGYERESHSGAAGATTDSFGLFFLRIFGMYVQSTHITLQAGLRGADRPEGKYRDAVAGVSSSIYIGRYFGIEGLYRHYFDSVPGTTPFTLGGARYEGGAFIDFKFLRVYGKYFSEPETLTQGANGVSTSTTVTNKGIGAGMKLFF